MAAQYFHATSYQLVSVASVTDITPPTFAGINSITARPNGSLRPVWLVATDVTTPIRYEVYVQASTASGLFNTSNITYITNNLTIDVFQLANNTLLVKGVTYYVGVRAVDAVGNRNTNTTSLSVASLGVLDDDLAAIAISLAATEALLAIDELNLSAEITSLGTISSNLAATEALLATDEVNLSTEVSNLGTTASAIAATEVLLAADEVSLSAEVVNLSTEVTNLISVEADISSDAQKIENAANLLISTVL